MKLLIRADAGPDIGIGHVMRCLALAQAARERSHETVLLSATLPAELRQRIEGDGVRVETFEGAPGSVGDLTASLGVVEAMGTDLVVLDGYRFTFPFQREVQATGARLLVIDDHGHLDRYAADVLMNQNLGAEPRWYGDGVGAIRLLLGPRFALLRTEFRGGRVATRGSGAAEKPLRLLVTMGGGAAGTLTARRIVQSLRSTGMGPEAAVRVVVGAGGAVPQPASDPNGPEIELLESVSHMAALMDWANFAVSAGGSTCWELARMGVPFLTVELAENQKIVARGLAETGYTKNLGWHEDLTDEYLACEIGRAAADTQWRRSAAAGLQELVDGRGAERVVEVVEQMNPRRMGP